MQRSDNMYQIRFISINNELPNTELREVISRGIWYDDYNFIFAVKERGIFIYNVQTQSYRTLKTGNGEFMIHNIENNKLYYDDDSLEIQ